MLLHTLSDKELVSIYLDGKMNALETLVSRHRDRIYTFIISKVRQQALAEDIFQDTFFKVINSLKKGIYNEEGKFLPWVMRIAHNLVIDHFRKAKRMPIAGKPKNDEDTFDIFDVIGNGEQSKEEVMMVGEQHDQLRLMIQELPDEQKEVLMMRHYEELSFKEIAEKTGVSINTALGRMRYALINLRKMMELHNIDLVIQ
jgi:RNA polymerase sigma-70 factor (ECF subfamily)